MKKICLILTLMICLQTPVFAQAISPEPEYTEPNSIHRFDHKFGLIELRDLEMYALMNLGEEFFRGFSRYPMKVMNNGLVMYLNSEDKAAFFDRFGEYSTEYIYETFPVTNPKTGEKSYPFLNDSGKGDGASDLIPVCRAGKFGFINSECEEVIPASFDYAYGFYDGMARICTGGVLSEYGTYINCKYGYINETGEIILPADSYWIAEDFSVGYARVSNGTRYDLIGKDGRVVDFGGASVLWHDGEYVFLCKDGLYGVSDMNGNTVIPYGYETDVLDFGNNFIVGTAVVNSSNTVVYKAPDGSSLVPLDYAYERGLACAKISVPAGDGNPYHNFEGLVTEDGKVILEPKYENVTVLGEGIIHAATQAENFIFDYEGNFIYKINGNSPEKSRNGVYSVLDFELGTRRYVKNPVYDKYVPSVKVIADGKEPDFDVLPFYGQGYAYIPLRAVFEAMGAEIFWDDTAKTASARLGGTEILVTRDSVNVYKNGNLQVLAAPVIVKDERIMVLQEVFEIFGFDVRNVQNGDLTVKIEK